jgi:hypothetical protein
MTQFKIGVCVFLQNEASFCSYLQRALLFAREVGAQNGVSSERSQYACYFAWQLRTQVAKLLKDALEKTTILSRSRTLLFFAKRSQYCLTNTVAWIQEGR